MDTMTQEMKTRIPVKLQAAMKESPHFLMHLPEDYPAHNITPESITYREIYDRDAIYPSRVPWIIGWNGDFNEACYEKAVRDFHVHHIVAEKIRNWRESMPVLGIIERAFEGYVDDFLSFCYPDKKNLRVELRANPTIFHATVLYRDDKSDKVLLMETEYLHGTEFSIHEQNHDAIIALNNYGAALCIISSAFSQIMIDHWRYHETVSPINRKTHEYKNYINTLYKVSSIFMVLYSMDSDITNDVLEGFQRDYYGKTHPKAAAEAKVPGPIIKLIEIYFYTVNIATVSLKHIKKLAKTKPQYMKDAVELIQKRLTNIRTHITNMESLIFDVGITKACYQMTQTPGTLSWSQILDTIPSDPLEKRIITRDDELKRIYTMVSIKDTMKLHGICAKFAPFCFSDSLDLEYDPRCHSLVPMMTLVMNFHTSIFDVLYAMSEKKQVQKVQRITFDYLRFLVISHSSKTALLTNVDKWIAVNRKSYDSYRRCILSWTDPAENYLRSEEIKSISVRIPQQESAYSSSSDPGHNSEKNLENLKGNQLQSSNKHSVKVKITSHRQKNAAVGTFKK